jgi:hypothetical protein
MGAERSDGRAGDGETGFAPRASSRAMMPASDVRKSGWPLAEGGCDVCGALSAALDRPPRVAPWHPAKKAKETIPTTAAAGIILSMMFTGPLRNALS